jgi:hypothetical protein
VGGLEAVFEALSPSASVERESWGGDSPGRSGVWKTAVISADGASYAVATLQQVVLAIDDFGIKSGSKKRETKSRVGRRMTLRNDQPRPGESPSACTHALEPKSPHQWMALGQYGIKRNPAISVASNQPFIGEWPQDRAGVASAAPPGKYDPYH